MKSQRTEDLITEQIIGAAIQIHRDLGPGLFEKVYESILERKLQNLGLRTERQRAVPLIYEDMMFESAFRADLIVENTVILEIKAVEDLTRTHKKQLLTYLKLTGLPVGLLINFNSAILINGIVRLVNELPEPLGEISLQ